MYVFVKEGNYNLAFPLTVLFNNLNAQGRSLGPSTTWSALHLNLLTQTFA